MNLIPKKGKTALDVGARDGYLSVALTNYFDSVTALDLEKPSVIHRKVLPLKGDITSLEFRDNSFDLVLCSEVLEHISPSLVGQACFELGRVTKEFLIIGVPYKQDLRVGRVTCYTCGQANPRWGHVNTFNEQSLKELFLPMRSEKISFVGESKSVTNFLSVRLMDLAGNPYGNYSQEEGCIYCGAKLCELPQRNFSQKIYTRLAHYVNEIQQWFHSPHPNWVHILFRKDT